MRIAIDIRCLAEGKKTGVEEYTINLLDEVFRLDKDNEYLLFFNSYKKFPPKIVSKWLNCPNVSLRSYRFPNKLLNFCLWYFKRPFLDKLLEVDVFFSPNPIFTSVSRHCFYLLTVHDLSFEVFPEFFNTYRRIWHWLVNPRKLTERADKVLAVSHSTKKDLKKIYRVPGKKIKVLYPGISSKIKPSYNKKCLEELFKKRGFVFPDKYFLFLATLEPRKNLISVLLAFDRLWKEGKIDHWLVVAGEEGWLFSETAKVFQSMEFKDKVIFLGGVSEEARKILYSCAQMFIYPSFYEGFGFPPLESLACNGGVVICSSNSSLPEVVGEAALLINPYNPEELAWAMERGVKDWELRKILKEKGKKQSQRFSKSRSAEQFLEQLPNR